MKPTAKQIRRFYAIRKASNQAKQKQKLREDNANVVLKNILMDSSFFLNISKDKSSSDPLRVEDIEALVSGINEFLDKLETDEIKVIFKKK